MTPIGAALKELDSIRDLLIEAQILYRFGGSRAYESAVTAEDTAWVKLRDLVLAHAPKPLTPVDTRIIPEYARRADEEVFRQGQVKTEGAEAVRDYLRMNT